MHILLAYATYSGTTADVSQLIADGLAKKEHQIERKEIKDVSFEELFSYDLVILGTPTWEDAHQDFTSFIKQAKDKTLAGKSYAIFGLGDISFPDFCKGVDTLEAFVKQLQGTLIIPSLRIDSFYTHESENEKKVMTWIEEISKI